MIIANLGVYTIGVTFQHGEYTVAKNRHIAEAPGRRRYTTAHIWQLSEEQRGWRKPIASATVRCFWKDKMTREEGRKKALKAAFKIAAAKGQITREERIAFWPTYHAKSQKHNPLNQRGA